MPSIPIYTVNIPEYKVDEEPNFKAIGSKLDACLVKNFSNKHVAVRCLGSQDHPGKTIDELIQIIRESGTDRYDSKRSGDRYENIDGKHIDFFALDVKVSNQIEFFHQMVEPFYTYPKIPIRLDIAIIYDMSKLEIVEHKYLGRENEIKRDGFIFKDPSHKADALLGIIKIAGDPETSASN